MAGGLERKGPRPGNDGGYGASLRATAGGSRQAGEEPLLEASAVEFEEIGEAVDSFERARVQFVEIVEEMLGDVVGGVADEGLGVDDEPQFAVGAENVAGVEVGGEEDL